MGCGDLAATPPDERTVVDKISGGDSEGADACRPGVCELAAALIVVCDRADITRPGPFQGTWACAR